MTPRWLAGALALAAGAATAADCPTDRAEVETAGGGVAAFAVEIADDPAERARGLMFRDDLPVDAGMLFVFEGEAPRAFWMRNTPLPLDMLFFDARGRLCGLVERAQPYTDTPRRSDCDALAVLEVNGGLAERLGMGIGARIRHAAFGADAAWPCDVARPPDAG